jgi:integrase
MAKSVTVLSGTFCYLCVLSGQTKKKRKKPKVSSNKLLFTQAFVDKVTKDPSGKRLKFLDSKIPGLTLDVMASGSKIYRFYRTVNYRQQWHTIGAHPAITLDQARNEAVVLSAKLIQGSDFAAERQAKESEITVGELAEFYLDQYAADRCTTAADMRRNFFRWFEDALDIPVLAMSSSLLQIRINKLASGKHYYRANRALELIKAMYNWGIRKGFCETNPAAKVDSFRERPRERFNQPEEFEPLLTQINKYQDDRIRDFLLLSLYTGARSGNILAMRWDQVDFTLGTWQIPRTKNGDSQTIALSDASLDVLSRRKDASRNSIVPWVLPGGGKAGPTSNHLVEPKKAWATILKRAGIKDKDLRVHDLRRTAGSYMAIAGVDTPTIQKALGHRSMAAASIYQRVNNDPAKRGMDQAIQVMTDFAKAGNKTSRRLLSSKSESGRRSRAFTPKKSIDQHGNLGIFSCNVICWFLVLGTRYSAGRSQGNTALESDAAY